MPIIQKQGNIFETSQPALAHGVNIRGVMGAGIAKTVRQNYPDVYKLYREQCVARELSVGDVLPVFSVKGTPNRWIFNLATQDDPGPSARYEWVEESVRKALDLVQNLGLSGIAFPRIGAGIGGLNWSRVEAIITAEAAKHPSLEIELWEFVPTR